jgi:hypothetical protein
MRKLLPRLQHAQAIVNRRMFAIPGPKILARKPRVIADRGGRSDLLVLHAQARAPARR